MNTAIKNLENDHVHILRLIDVMAHITTLKEVKITHLETIVDLIRNFADGLHHAKEEQLLFPKMVEKGFSFEQGPIAVMMNDHVNGRKYVKGMVDNINLYRDGNKDALPIIFDYMRAYIDLLRAHIAKENNILFRMADNAFSPDEQQLLLEQFAKAESNFTIGTSTGDYINRIELLALEYNLA